jgi:hypothetical protein
MCIMDVYSTLVIEWYLTVNEDARSAIDQPMDVTH